jgi:hypothetical protein
LDFFFVPSRFSLYPDEKVVAGSYVHRGVVVILLAAAAAVCSVAILGPGIHFSL